MGADSPFGEVYRAHVGAVTGFFARRCRDPQTVADLTSETFVQALGSFQRFDPGRGSARAWLIGIAHNVFRGYASTEAAERDTLRRLGGQLVLGEDGVDELAARIDAQSAGRALLERTARFPEAERIALELVDVMRMSPSEAAEAVGVSAGTLRVRLFVREHAYERKGSMGFDDQLWSYLVEEHDADLATGPLPVRPRRAATRVGFTAGSVVAAAALASVVVLDQSSGESPWAKQVIRRAAAVLAPAASANTILHIVATETLSPLAQQAMDTTVSTLSEEAWIQQGPPWGERAIVQVPGGPQLEDSSTGQIYNATTQTVYPAPSLPSGTPSYTLTPTGDGGSYKLSVTLPQGGVFTQTLDAATAEDLRDGTDDVQWSVGWDSQTQTQTVSPLVVPSAKQLRQIQAQQPSPASTSFAAELQGLLDSGHARVTQTTTSNGQPAIEISSVDPQSGPQTNYYVNPTTYAPIELDTFGYDSPDDVTRVQFATYETLPLAGNQQLLQVTVPSTATVDNAPADYWQADGLPRPF